MAVAYLLTACTGTVVNPKPLPVTLGSGFVLLSLLDQSENIKASTPVERWLDQPWYAEVDVTFGTDYQLATINSCDDYLSAPQPIHPVGAQDISALEALAVNCHAGNLITTARPSRESFIEAGFVDENLPQHMPSILALVISVSERASLAPEQKWGQVNTVVAFTEMAADAGRFELDFGFQELAVMARGDFTGDGLEDVLLSSSDSVRGGSYAGKRLFLVSRKGAQQPYQVTQVYPREEGN